jgi:hypothetical protein
MWIKVLRVCVCAIALYAVSNVAVKKQTGKQVEKRFFVETHTHSCCSRSLNYGQFVKDLFPTYFSSLKN